MVVQNFVYEDLVTYIPFKSGMCQDLALVNSRMLRNQSKLCFWICLFGVKTRDLKGSEPFDMLYLGHILTDFYRAWFYLYIISINVLSTDVVLFSLLIMLWRGRRDRDRIVVGFTTSCANSTYHHLSVSSNPTQATQHYVIKFVSDLRQVDGFLWVLRFPPPIKLIATI